MPVNPSTLGLYLALPKTLHCFHFLDFPSRWAHFHYVLTSDGRKNKKSTSLPKMHEHYFLGLECLHRTLKEKAQLTSIILFYGNPAELIG